MSARILIAEDDAASRESLKAALERVGHQLETAGDGETALALARSWMPDLILLDVVMPKLDGKEVLRAIKDSPDTRDIPVLFLTAKASLSERIAGLHLGASDYIVKPFETEELKARVTAALRLKSLQDDLKRRNAELGRTLSELHKISEAKEALAHLLVHDLKTPLTGVLGTLDMLSDNSGPALGESQRRRLVDLCLRSTRQVLRMVEEILEVQELEENRIQPQIEPFDAKLLAELCLDKGRHFQPDKKIIFTLESPALPGQCKADRGLVERVLDNLLSNSAKFCKAGDRVVLRLTPTPEAIQFCVEDTGPGVPDSYKSMVFDKFYRIESRDGESRPGSGLGLTFCKLAIEAHAGSIWIEDTQPKGARFCFKIPTNWV